MTPDNYICSTCKEMGSKSVVFLATEATDIIQWNPRYDEEGKLHSHNPNKVYNVFKCAKGHVHEFSWLKQCWCGWGKDSYKEVTGENVEETVFSKYTRGARTKFDLG